MLQCIERRERAEAEQVSPLIVDRLVAAERRAISEVAKLTELSVATESQLVQSPRFLRVHSTILGALAKFPDALSAVLHALSLSDPEAARVIEQYRVQTE